MKPNALEHKRFHKLVVLCRAEKNSRAGKARFKCICDCGNTTVVVGASLLSGHTTSCGCHRVANNKKLKLGPPGQAAHAMKYAAYKKSARSRNLCFDLTPEQHAALIHQDCFYCGCSPPLYNPYTALNLKKRKYPVLQETIDRAAITANGIDRIDNSKGYTIDNCVPCCTACNESKSDRSQEDFISRAYRIVELDTKRKAK